MLNREDKNCGQARWSWAVDSRRPLSLPCLYANDMSATSQNNAVCIWKLIPDENIEVKNKLFIPLHSQNDAPNNMFPTFLEKGVDIFFWLEVQWRMHIWDS